MLVTGTGCSSSGPTIEFRSVQSGAVYTQQFTKAYFARQDGGEYNLILTDGVAAVGSNPSGPIASSQTPVTNQIICIRVLWKPLGSKADSPSSTNAVIDWQVRGNDPGRNDSLHYRGAGFVAIYDYGSESRFLIRSAHMELAASTGQLRDPLGPASMTGSFIAQRNDGQVTSAMAMMKDETAKRFAQSAASFEGPPPRTPLGP